MARQWPNINDLCHTFFACCASQKTHCNARITLETCVIQALQCVCKNSTLVFARIARQMLANLALLCVMCKNVLQNLIPRATA